MAEAGGFTEILLILGRNAAARELGISGQALGRAFRDGRVKQTPEGLYDVEACRIALKKNSNLVKQKNARSQQRPKRKTEGPTLDSEPTTPLDQNPEPTQCPPGGDPEGEEYGGTSYSEAQRQREWIRVEKEKLNLEKQRLSLVELMPVNAYVAGMIMQAREELIRIPLELRDKLAQETDPIKCQEMLLDRIDQTLEKMSEFKPLPV